MAERTIHAMSRIVARDDKIEEMRAIFQDAAERTIAEPGCLRLDFFQNLENRAEFVFYAEFKDAKSAEEHDKSDWHMELATKKLPSLVASPPVRSICRKLA